MSIRTFLSVGCALAACSGAPPEVRGGALSADREGVPLARLAALVDPKLKELWRSGLLEYMPDNLVIQVRVDASGAVTEVRFDPPVGRGGRLLEARILAWRFEAWATPGLTRLRIPVRLPK